MNITLSSDAKIVEKARLLARAQGTSLNQLIRDYLEKFCGSQGDGTNAGEFKRLATEKAGRSAAGFRFDREEAHARR